MAKRATKKATKKVATPKKLTERQIWEQKFIERITGIHKRNIASVAKRLLKKIDSAKNSMVARSKKYELECNVTVDELRQLTYDMYGEKCKYTGRLLKIDTMVYDHIVPVSKGGKSNIDNIQIISRFANTMKGSLEEASFQILLDWLETIPEELKRDISLRLAGGKC